MYHAIGAGLIRASAFPLTATLPPCPVPYGDAAVHTANCRQWIAHVWRDDSRADAIELAAPALADAIRKVLDGTARPSRIRRTTLSLTRYLLRMRYRATPFGLFAGATPVRVGREAHVHWGSRHTVFARADAAWLHKVIADLEQDPDVLRRLAVVADPTCTVRGVQITVSHQPGMDGPTETTLRRTRAAEAVLALAQSPITVADLVAKLRVDYPNTSPQTIEAMLCDLVAHRVLLTTLHAPMTCDDALGHLVAQLDAARSSTGPGTTPTAELRQIHQLLQRHDRARPAAQRELRAQATAAMTALAGPTEHHLAVTMHPACDIILPEAVVQEAQRALEVIARTTPYPNGTPAWQDYRARFLERYSLGTVVPVRDLTDPDIGLGFPAGYRGTVLPHPVLATTSRDEHLLALVQDAVLTDRREITLTEDAVQALSTGTPVQVPAHIEFGFTVLAQSARALAAGRFALSTVGLSLAAGTTTGRFLATLEPADRDRIATTHPALPTLTTGALRGQVSGPPLKVPITNVGRAPRVVPELLTIGEHDPDATLDLDDLGIVADADRLYLVSFSTGRFIEPSVMNAVELSSGTHPLIRFVCEVHRSHTAVLIPFFWGAASRLPFLPEVRVGRTILSAACWRLRARDLGDGRDWHVRLADWRLRYGVPRTVYVGNSDQQLRLDLDLPTHQQLLRAELNRHRTAVLHEAPPESAFGWIGHAHEVTMPFASDQPPIPPPVGPTVVADQGSSRLPGASEWLYLKLYGSKARTPEVLTTHVPRLVRAWGPAAAWWYTRYADPDPHLRLRLRPPGGPKAFGKTAQRTAAWAAELRNEGLIQRVQWDTDQPEHGRYGTGAALEAAENVFVADSAAALAQLSLQVPADLQPAITAASFVDLASAFLGSAQAGHAWLTTHLRRSDGTPAPRNVQAEANRLSATAYDQHPIRELAGGDRVAAAWDARHRALDGYRKVLDATGTDPAAVLPSLLHMHHNRVAGIDRDAEATCRRLARAAALSWTARTEGAVRCPPPRPALPHPSQPGSRSPTVLSVPPSCTSNAPTATPATGTPSTATSPPSDR
ncbi:lantibiotic dehydratase [Streptomyces sp. NPDC003077]|uniref:lantibiotic dehydratase n=1 Tax=Streptomyces sp. NPDC003077 TaxID=3154443 RepID=UPI0033A10FB1